MYHRNGRESIYMLLAILAGGGMMKTWYAVYINTIAGRQWWDSYTNKQEALNKIAELKLQNIYAYLKIY